MKAAVKFICLAAVFTAAIGCTSENPRVVTRTNLAASLTGTLPWNPLQGRVITSWIDKGSGTMSTLYGNDLAIGHARTTPRTTWPSGAILSLVTWKQQEDERWFGAKIPATPQSVEFVMVGATPDQQAQYSYKKFQGQPLQQTLADDGPTPNYRTAYLLSQPAAEMP